MKSSRIAFLAFLLVFCLVPRLAAQSRTTSAVRGTVIRGDSIGEVIPDVNITIRHQETGAERSVATNQRGRFLMPLLPPGGPYTITAFLLGYGEQTRENIYLIVGETLTLDFALQEEALEVEGINVEVERTDVFNPTQVGPATRLDEVTVEAVPILSRDFMDLAVLSPMVKKTSDGGFSVAGQNTRYNSILVDGASHKDVFGLTAGGIPGGQAGAKIIPMDAVAQYEILVSPFDVRLSGFTGGVMNAVTRTGTNEWWTRGFAVHRNESLMGDLTLPTGPVEASGVDRSLFGLSVGGPIIRDKAHFFVATEFERRNQPPTGFNLHRDDPFLVRISPDDLTTFQDFFDQSFGIETGIAGPYTLRQELSNVFARVDWNLGAGHRITIRNVFAVAENDENPNRSYFEPYELSSNAVFRKSVNNTTSFQLFSELEGGGGNELNLDIQHTADETTPATDWPQVEVDLLSSIEGVPFQREIRAGSQFFAQENDLEQTTIRVTNSLNLVFGDDTWTFGASGGFYDINHRFVPAAHGDWFFASMEDVANNAPQRYQRTVVNDGYGPTANFRILEWGLFTQREIHARDGLTFRVGFRMDVPHVLDTPKENAEIKRFFQKSTSSVPSGMPLLSPRVGFNWQSSGDRMTQVRGGLGMFAGQLPFVWLSNAFHNNGLAQTTLLCQGRWTDDPLTGNTAPYFDPDNAPTDCLFGAPTEQKIVTMFDEDFKYPQVYRISLAVDRELWDWVSGSLGVLLNHSVNQVSLMDLNLGKPTSDLGDIEGYGGYARRYYGNKGPNGTAIPFVPNPRLPEFGQVLLATNKGKDWAFSLTAEVRGTIRESFGFQAGYTFSRSWDEMSLTYTDMVSNMGFNPTSDDPNRPALRPSNYDRPHKVVAAVYGAPFALLPNTEISVLYTGESGTNFSYVYRGDMNGDGYPGLGAAFDRTNDLLYVPNEATQLPAGLGTTQLLAYAMDHDPCLRESRGKMIKRNACRAPWQNRLDLRTSHSVTFGGADIRFEADIINVLNLVNSEWGKIETIRPVVSLIEPLNRRPTALISGWAGGVLPARDEEGRLVPSNPWSVATPDSQWQAQFGVRVTFDQALGRQ
jgi:hypothetical protein